jgi:macrolide transport system ATP-binding/permease protein
MRVLLQDLDYAFRQLPKTPGFTATVLLTLALGIGANSAIFTLVNAILLHNQPVTAPKTLIRIGDNDDCCVNSGWNDNEDYSLFATDTYYMFKKSLLEFEVLAAMESGYAWRPITVRRSRPQTAAKSVMATFVSGNYFRVFGLSPAAGRLFVDVDDQKGAPITAVMSLLHGSRSTQAIRAWWEVRFTSIPSRPRSLVLRQRGFTGIASIPIRPSTSFP